MDQKIRESKRKYRPKTSNKDFNYEDIFLLVENLYEYDIQFSSRVCIDLNIRVNFWYHVKIRKNFVIKLTKEENLVEKPDFTVLAFDIETTKEPLKFPDPDIDSIILISYVIDEETFLIVNRQICSKDV